MLSRKEAKMKRTEALMKKMRYAELFFNTKPQDFMAFSKKANKSSRWKKGRFEIDPRQLELPGFETPTLNDGENLYAE